MYFYLYLFIFFTSRSISTYVVFVAIERSFFFKGSIPVVEWLSSVIMSYMLIPTDTSVQQITNFGQGLNADSNKMPRLLSPILKKLHYLNITQILHLRVHNFVNYNCRVSSAQVIWNSIWTALFQTPTRLSSRLSHADETWPKGKACILFLSNTVAAALNFFFVLTRSEN